MKEHHGHKTQQLQYSRHSDDSDVFIIYPYYLFVRALYYTCAASKNRANKMEK